MSDRSVAIKGGFWTSVSTAVVLVSQVARVMILTRFLDKSDFGVVSIINMVIGLCITFTDLGFASVIMYKQKLTIKEFSSLFWLQLIFFFVIYGIMCVTSPLISSFYEEPILIKLMPLAGLSLVFQAFGKLYDSVLQKKYYFKLLAFRNIIASVVSLLLAWYFAAIGMGVYSLVLSTLINVAIFNIWNLLSGIKHQRISLVLNIGEVKSLLKIGVYQTGTQILDFVSNKLDVIIIGKMLGTEVLGVYDLAKDLIVKFIGFVKTVVSKVSLPILANSNQDDDAVRRKFLLTTRIIAYICIPVCITISVFSKEIVTIIYGVKFLDAAGLMAIFSILAMLNSISSFIDMLGVLKGRTDLNFRNTIYRVIITIPMVILTCKISISAVAWGQLLSSLLLFAILWNIVVRGTYRISFKDYFAQFQGILMSTAIVAIFVSLLKHFQIIRIGGDVLWVLYLIIYFILLAIVYRIFLKKDLVELLFMFKKN